MNYLLLLFIKVHVIQDIIMVILKILMKLEDGHLHNHNHLQED